MQYNIKLPLYSTGDRSVLEASLRNRDDGNSINKYRIFASPTAQNPLSQIPKGSNPRYLDDNNRISKEVSESYKQDPNFPIKCGGISAIIDDDSFDIIEEDGRYFATFSCSEHGVTGHYDGQHTIAAIDKAVLAGDVDAYTPQHVDVSLVERSAFKTVEEIRNVAKAVNSRSKQKVSSELNIVGTFDDLKNNISYCNHQNIWWSQNQKNNVDLPLENKKEVYSWQVISLLSTFLPLTYGPKGTNVSDVCSYAKQGEKVTKRISEKLLSKYFLASFGFVDTLLEMSDYIQDSSKRVLGPDAENYSIVKNNTGKRQLSKSVQDREPFKAHLFADNNRQVEYGLHKDLMPLICYSIIRTCYQWDDKKEQFSSNYSLQDMKDLWDSAGKSVLAEIQGRYDTHWESSYKSRWADLALDESLWHKLVRIVQIQDETLRQTRPSWPR